MSGFAQARADLAEAMSKLAALDRVFALLDGFAVQLAAQGHHPELRYDAAAGRIALEVAVGRVPPRVSLAVEEAVPVALPAPRPKPAPAERAASVTRLTKFRTGPWSDAELMTATAMIREGRTNKEIAERLNRTATGIHFKLDPLRAELAEGEGDSIPSETEGVPTVEPEKPGDGSHGSRQPQADADATRAGEQAPEAGEQAPAAAGGSPAPVKGGSAPLDLPLSERRVWEHLEAIAHPDWPPARDLDMVERMVRGDGAASTAEGMGIPKSVMVGRWRRLFPDGVTIELQARMVRVLKHRIAAEVPA